MKQLALAVGLVVAVAAAGFFGASIARSDRKELDRVVEANAKNITWLTEQLLPADGQPNWWCRPNLSCVRSQDICERADEQHPGCNGQRIAYCGGARGGDCYQTLTACVDNARELRRARRIADELIHTCIGVE